MIKVLIADDHKLMREGLKALLMTSKDIQVIGEARDGLEAGEGALRLHPDVVLMDVSMPDVNGVKATQQIHELDDDIKVLVVSGYADELLLRQSLRSGANGYILKSSNPDELAAAIRAVHRGEVYFSPDVFGILSEEMSKLGSPASK
jgi:DNA-binding NarL/FixJ family response regulator